MESAPIPLPSLVIFDLDGVVYRGEEPVPGAAGLVAAIHDAGRVVRFATNNSMATRQDYVGRLAAQGIHTTAEEIVTSVWATVEHLRAHEPDVHSVLTVGADGMRSELRAAGFDATYAADAAPAEWWGEQVNGSYDAVVAGLDPRIEYRTLGIAAAVIRGGARFLATNADVRYPMPAGFVPGAGAIIAALRAASGVDPIVIGKPEPTMFRAILESCGVPPAQALVIGDNPDADVVAARRAGIPVALVLTGIADQRVADTLEGDRRPDWVAADPAALAERLGLRLS